ncbi:LacI family DNA-binding transcriptional regulator [Candidatus Symbiopectobacterium sp. 'North America']|uniref:LacI family DNA-binding transcriptional regulator n=1 Tax=Candidatus Symbiopectobacterium sp. 'North America' TaxID=2794574 RepID=UPI001FD2D9F6|nr:LacI family DNA-binding transcriptional regulator [Candidatus Symbiopectobacterium sp. 'North America']
MAGVSRSAVSRTFTPGSSVSAETRRKVLAAAQTLNYHVNHLARGQPVARCVFLAVIWPRLIRPACWNTSPAV